MSEDWKNKDIQPYLKDKPANWSDTDNDWVAFKGNEKLEQELASIKKKQSEILERLDKPIDTQVTGSNVEDGILVKQERNVEEVTVLKSLSLTDTNSFSSPIVNVSKFSKFLVFVKNTHDVPVELVFTPGAVNSMYWEDGKWSKRTSTKGTVEVPKGNSADLYNVTDFFTEYRGNGFKEVQIRGKATKIPTSGSLECFVMGVPN